MSTEGIASCTLADRGDDGVEAAAGRARARHGEDGWATGAFGCSGVEDVEVEAGRDLLREGAVLRKQPGEPIRGDDLARYETVRSLHRVRGSARRPRDRTRLRSPARSTPRASPGPGRRGLEPTPRCSSGWRPARRLRAGHASSTPRCRTPSVDRGTACGTRPGGLRASRYAASIPSMRNSFTSSITTTAPPASRSCGRT